MRDISHASVRTPASRDRCWNLFWMERTTVLPTTSFTTPTTPRNNRNIHGEVTEAIVVAMLRIRLLLLGKLSARSVCHSHRISMILDRVI